jgi:hypothetical protein
MAKAPNRDPIETEAAGDINTSAPILIHHRIDLSCASGLHALSSLSRDGEVVQADGETDWAKSLDPSRPVTTARPRPRGQSRPSRR